MTVPALVINDDGISGPTYAEVLAAVTADFQSIYGSDANLAADSQDGQLLAVFSQAIYDSQQSAIKAFNDFRPNSAQGVGLSSIVKINGLQRQVATPSQCIVTIGGVAGTIITDGVVGDNAGFSSRWLLPASVTIPDSGTIQVTATCEEDGSTPAAAASLTVILTPTLGWQTVTNAASATEGNPVESDAALRVRQGQSTSRPALSVIDSIYGNVAALEGVSRLQIYENDTDATDANGIPSHSIALVAEGGDAQEIGETIALIKTPGTGTDGDVEVEVIDSRGVPALIRFYDMAAIPITVEIEIAPLTGYTSAIGTTLKAAVVDFINTLAIGEDSYLSRLFSPANLGGTGDGATFVVSAIRQSRDGDPPAAANVVIDFNEAAITDSTLVTLTVV